MLYKQLPSNHHCHLHGFLKDLWFWKFVDFSHLIRKKNSNFHLKHIYIYIQKQIHHSAELRQKNTFCGYLNFQRTLGSGNISDSENCQFWFLEKIRMPKSSPMHTKACFTLGVGAEKTWGQLWTFWACCLASSY